MASRWTSASFPSVEQTREAALIDPVLEQAERDLEIVSQIGLTRVRPG